MRGEGRPVPFGDVARLRKGLFEGKSRLRDADLESIMNVSSAPGYMQCKVTNPASMHETGRVQCVTS